MNPFNWSSSGGPNVSLMNEWLNIMLEEIDRKKQEEEADRKENERRAKKKSESKKHQKPTRNNE